MTSLQRPQRLGTHPAHRRTGWWAWAIDRDLRLRFVQGLDFVFSPLQNLADLGNLRLVVRPASRCPQRGLHHFSRGTEFLGALHAYPRSPVSCLFLALPYLFYHFAFPFYFLLA